MGTVGEPLPANIDASFRQIHDDKALAQILKEYSPSPIARGDLKDRVGRHKGADAWQNGAIPLHVRVAPRCRPLLASLRPIIRLVKQGTVFFDCGHDASLNSTPIHGTANIAAGAN